MVQELTVIERLKKRPLAEQLFMIDIAMEENEIGKVAEFEIESDIGNLEDGGLDRDAINELIITQLNQLEDVFIDGCEYNFIVHSECYEAINYEIFFIHDEPLLTATLGLYVI